MKLQLHLLLRPPDPWVVELIAATGQQPGVEIEVLDLTREDPDYGRLVERIFAAESVATW